VLGRARFAELIGHARQVYDGFRHYLAHDLRAVHLDGDHTQREVAGDLLVQPAGDHELEDFPLAFGEGPVARLQSASCAAARRLARSRSMAP
jgi:hypothetical protein